MPANLQINARWEAIRDAREAAKKSEGKNAPSPSVMVAWAVVRAMEKHAPFRRVMLDDDRIIENEDFDLGIAVSLADDRLATAVVTNANQLAWPEFVKRYNETVAATRGGRVDAMNAPIVISSLGAFGVRAAAPIVVPPSVGTLFVGSAHHEVSPNGKKMYVSIGSASNVSDNAEEADRARIFEFNPDGSGQKVYAWGIRNAVGIAMRPGTDELWMSVNERDELGDNLVPDYLSHVTPGGFYGWPWFYLGNHQDPRHEGSHREWADKVIVPDVLVQAHSASLNLCFYDGKQFPEEYRGDVFAAFHGSWNRSRRTGYKIVRVPLENGKSSGVYEDFVTGFVTPEGNVWGRPVGVAVAKDGSLFFSEDAHGTIWRVSVIR